MTEKIILENIKKEYENFQLGEISFSIPRGYITGFIGKNGQGKTTTIRTILSLIGYEGNIFVDGESNKKTNFLQKTGIVMDESFIAKDWTMSMINTAMEIGYENWDSKRFFKYLKRFEIPVTSKFKDLSKGMKTKLSLSTALSHGANLLILDEPTSGLDPSMREEFLDIIQEFMEDEENTVLFSSHITQDLEAIADHIAFIDKGKLVDFATKEDFIGKYRLIKGGLDQLEGVQDILLGKKVSSVAFEGLIDYKDSDKISNDLLVERASIENIMVLYGREK